MSKNYISAALLLGTTMFINASSSYATFDWTSVDENNDVRYGIQLNDTIIDDEIWNNQVTASQMAYSTNNISQTIINKTGASSLAEAIKNSDEASDKYAEAVAKLEDRAALKELLKEAYAAQNGVSADQITDETIDSLSDDETRRLFETSIGTDYMQNIQDKLGHNLTWNPKETVQKDIDTYTKQKEQYASQTWDSITQTIRDTVHNDEELSGEGYANGKLIAEQFGISQNELLNPVVGSTVTTKDEAYNYYYNKVQADLDKNPTQYESALKTLQSYDSDLKSLSMSDDTSRDYIASYVAAIASEHQKLDTAK